MGNPNEDARRMHSVSESRIANRLADRQAQMEGQKFVWVTASGIWLIDAANENEAYEMVISNRMQSGGQSQEEAESSFEKDDQLLPVDGNL